MRGKGNWNGLERKRGDRRVEMVVEIGAMEEEEEGKDLEREGGERRRREEEKAVVVGEWRAAKLSIVLQKEKKQ